MSYKVRTIPHFEKALKRLAKKYPSLKMGYVALLDSLEENSEQGAPLGNHCFKIRIAVASKGKGVRAGNYFGKGISGVVKNDFYLICPRPSNCTSGLSNQKTRCHEVPPKS